MIILFLHYMLKEKLSIFLINTLLLHIPLLALTDRKNDIQRNKYTHCTWAGGTFFPVVLLCQFLVLAGNRFLVFGVTYVLSVQYSCVVVSVFWLWQEIVLKMTTHFYKKYLLGYLIMIRQLLDCNQSSVPETGTQSTRNRYLE